MGSRAVKKGLSVRGRVGAVNILADNNSTPNVGTTIHTIIHTNLRGNFHVVNVRHNCGNLLSNRYFRVGLHDISGVVSTNNAVLCATHYLRFGAGRNRSGNTTGYHRLNVSTLIIVNNSNSCHNTHRLTRHNVPVVNLPNAVSGSVTYASCAVNCSATVGATLRVVSGLHSAARDRSHYDIIRIVNHGTNCVTLGITVTSNTVTILLPRGRFSVRRSVLSGVARARHANGHRFVIVITRNVNRSRRVTGRVRTHANVSAHTAVLNRIRHNNSPALHSHIGTSTVNCRTIYLLRRNGCGHVINVGNRRLISCPISRTLRVAGALSPILVSIYGAVSV